jgi:hypothetical protein
MKDTNTPAFDEAQDDIDNGRVKRFADSQSLLRHLRSVMAPDEVDGASEAGFERRI